MYNKLVYYIAFNDYIGIAVYHTMVNNGKPVFLIMD